MATASAERTVELSTRQLANRLRAAGHYVSDGRTAEILGDWETAGWVERTAQKRWRLTGRSWTWLSVVDPREDVEP